jgi:transposase
VQDGIVGNGAEQAIVVAKARRQRRSVCEKRQIAEATLVPGSSIARVARAHGVNANQLFHWRKLYKQGLLEETSLALPRLLPVQISEAGQEAGLGTRCVESTQPRRVGGIRIEMVGKCRMTIEGIDERGLRTVLEYFLG